MSNEWNKQNAMAFLPAPHYVLYIKMPISYPLHNGIKASAQGEHEGNKIRKLILP